MIPPLLYLIVLRVGKQLLFDTLPLLLAQIEPLGQRSQRRIVRGKEHPPQVGHGSQRQFELHHLSRRDALGGDTRRKPFEVGYPFQYSADLFPQPVVAPKPLHHVEPTVEPRDILYRQRYPLLEQTPAHGSDRPVDDIREAAPLAQRVGRKEFEVAYGETVYPHVGVLVDARNTRNVAHILMFRKIQVVENGSCGRNAARHGVDAVPLERGGTELLAELLPVDILGKYPLVEFVGIVTGTERTSETLLPAPLVDDFLRGKIGQELVHVVVPPLGYVELPGRKVEKSHSRGLFPEMYRCEKRIFLVDEYVVAQHHAGSDQFDDSPLHDSLDELGILELLAHGHPFPCPDEFRQIGIQRMVGKTGQLHIAGRSVRPAGKSNTQNTARTNGIFAERFVKVTHPEQQHCIAVYRLDGVVLLHQRRLHIFPILRFALLSCHNATALTTCKVKKFSRKTFRETQPSTPPGGVTGRQCDGDKTPVRSGANPQE